MNSKKYNNFLIILLGLLSAFGPFVTDMYLPGLPSMVESFHCSVSLVQLGLTASLAGLAIGQLLIGPISDKVGRRRPLIWAMVIYVISTLFCVYAPTIQTFVVLRLIQGIAGAGGIVLSRCIATDVSTGPQLARLMAIIAALNGVAPVVAPVVGGMVLGFTDWRGVFWILFGLGILILLLSFFYHESLLKENRSRKSLIATFSLFGTVLKNSRFVLYMLQYAFVMATMFAYIASSPFIIQEHYGYSKLAFSLFFALNAFAIAGAAFFAAKTRNAGRAIKHSSAIILLMTVFEFFVLWTQGPFWLYEGILFVMLGFVGYTFPLSTTLAMDSERKNAGTASALFGASGFLMGGLVSPLVGMGNIFHSSAIIFVIAALISYLSAMIAEKIRKEN